MEIGWDDSKNEKIKAERGISFDEIAAELIAGRVVDICRILPGPTRGSSSSNLGTTLSWFLLLAMWMASF